MNLELTASPNAPGELLEQQLAEFRAEHPPKRLTRGSVEWRYFVGGRGNPVLLRLSGALGLAEFAFQQIRLFEPFFRVITPDYPAARTLAEMAGGLVAILDAEGVDRAHVSGGSFGGMLAQVLVRSAPNRVESLVLSHTGAPDGKARRVRTALIGAVPEALLRRLVKAKLGRTLGPADPFWRRYFDGAVDGMTRADILSRVRLWAEFARQRWGAGDLAKWPRRVLLLEGEDDPLFPAPARARLRALYPAAEVHRFTGTGHAAAVLRPEEYVAVVKRFLIGGRH